MPTTSQLPILIIGGGPAGLAAALALAQNNVPVRIIDKETEFHRSSRGNGLQPRSMEQFRFLGVYDDLHRVGRPIKPGRLYKLPGGTEIERTWNIIEKSPLTSDRPEDILILSQYLTEGVHRDHLAQRGIHVELCTEPTSIEQDVDGVTVVLKKIATEGSLQTETVRAPYVIGADGAKGFTRHAIGSKFVGNVIAADAHVLAEVEMEGLTDEYWHFWNVPDNAMIIMRPTEDPTVFFVAIVSHNKDLDVTALSENFDNLVAFIHDNTQRRDLVFKRCLGLALWKPKMMMADKFQEERVFIVGDAAHIHSPSGGQGLNTSVQDSFNLAWKLALVYKAIAPPSLLATYSAERIPVVAEMLRLTTALYARVTAQGPPAENLYNQTSLKMLDVNYRWSPIVLDARGLEGLDDAAMKARAYEGYPGEDVRAGDRAPEVPGLVDEDGKEVTLFALFKTYFHTILVFAPSREDLHTAESVVRATEKFAAGLVRTVIIARDGVSSAVAGADVYHDKDGLAYQTYGVGEDETKIVVVRPDGYVGAFVNNLDGFKAYFSTIFEI